MKFPDVRVVYWRQREEADKYSQICENLRSKNKCFCEPMTKMKNAYGGNEKYTCDVCKEIERMNRENPNADDYADRSDYLRKKYIEESLYE